MVPCGQPRWSPQWGQPACRPCRGKARDGGGSGQASEAGTSRPLSLPHLPWNKGLNSGAGGLKSCRKHRSLSLSPLFKCNFTLGSYGLSVPLQVSWLGGIEWKRRLNEKESGSQKATSHCPSFTVRARASPAQSVPSQDIWEHSHPGSCLATGRPERDLRAGRSTLRAAGTGDVGGCRGPTSKRMAPFPSASKALKRKCA